MSLFVQDVSVSLVALGAAVTLVWRVVRMFAPTPAGTGCSSCPTNCSTPPTAGEQNRQIIRPLVIHARHQASR